MLHRARCVRACLGTKRDLPVLRTSSEHRVIRIQNSHEFDSGRNSQCRVSQLKHAIQITFSQDYVPLGAADLLRGVTEPSADELGGMKGMEWNGRKRRNGQGTEGRSVVR